MTPQRTSGTRDLPEVADTEDLGRELAADLGPGDLVILDGPLGAGKTALTRGIAAGLGVAGRVSSPTFIIARQHAPGVPGGTGLVHVDAYRLGGLDDLDALDLDTDLDDSVVVVEWGEGVVERLVDEYLIVRLRRDDDTETRHATWEWVNR
ncbi:MULTISPECIES: tRNA (adenosine(37)-N6)-threonylcarbamoyltransferase complex ATPase subunit type 1 TsaE [Gordonia]|uniref:tRNA threonylcarbamoyladenosine biosynthesis protein TsaE n=2 Tax=Gordonia TaxID=2053 RepID=L7LP01_9ACTN|nr:MULTISPECIES: tRNA (adenosine(37)-N6)-threonylcarbamoyltransferase complex ATPase subunit type 1 TsaE [Gordonia]AUH69623.1 tRNA (adenosine(37)-N6)-threonylcarbamoyltransferase complex ATPase subunit type 1 TsaE [Gordonia sp. YC-JH1]KJR04924.1 ATP-binding protein [Gordonia sihwensis]KXT57439.1 ATP-binding protein [Gordonia sp. QH-12]MBY4570240.1 tRNA (adenosine(37)-N6)-threonylcarbamoyltransferase complex ATPase subunit type 1 TsaE [Gordonia sihwensis]WFN93886.1 tRNA (adenosine(37)-N6)-threo